MKFPRHAKIFRGQFDFAPYAGVCFLILIFLALNTSLVFTPGVPIELPEGHDLPGVAGATVVVAVDRQGKYYFDSQVIAETNLQSRLMAAVAKSPKEPWTLVVQADKAVPYELVVRLGKMARSVGIKEALLATRPQLFSPPATNAAAR